MALTLIASPLTTPKQPLRLLRSRRHEVEPDRIENRATLSRDGFVTSTANVNGVVAIDDAELRRRIRHAIGARKRRNEKHDEREKSISALKAQAWLRP